MYLFLKRVFVHVKLLDACFTTFTAARKNQVKIQNPPSQTRCHERPHSWLDAAIADMIVGQLGSQELSPRSMPAILLTQATTAGESDTVDFIASTANLHYSCFLPSIRKWAARLLGWALCGTYGSVRVVDFHLCRRRVICTTYTVLNVGL